MIQSKYNPAYFTLVSNNTDKELDQAFLNFVLYVIKKKNYTNINSVNDINIICEDFKKIIGFSLSYFVMENLLQMAHKQGFLEYNKKENTYIPDYNKIQKCPFMKKMYNSKNKFAELIKDFKNYSLNSLGNNLSNADAEKIIANFIEEQGLILYTQKNDYFNNVHEEYIFASYLKHVQKIKPEQLNYINSLIVGRITSELLLYEEKENTDYLNQLTVYLDAGFIFRLLGIDSIDRTQIYNNLLDEIHNRGIKTYIFNHTFVEIITIIDNSSKWINNPDFDASLATEASYYFVSNNFTVAEIENISNGLKTKLNAYGIEIVNLEYPQNVASRVVTEKTYYDSIVSYYKKQNSYFDEEEKQQTVELDALSFFFIDYLNNGICGSNLDIKRTFFVTTNDSLSKVSQNIITSIKKLPKNTIPFCVSDRFIGVLLWHTNSKMINEDSYNRLIVAMDAALLPNEQILRELTKLVDKAENDNSLTEEECYLLRTNKKAHNYLMSITQGNIEEFSAKTPLEILQGIRNEAKEEGKNEEREIANKQLDEKSAIISQKDSRIKDLCNENTDWKIRYFSAEKKEKEEVLKSEKTKLNKIRETQVLIEKKAIFRKRLCALACAFCIIVIIAIGSILFFNKDTHDFFNLWAFVVPLTPFAFGYIVLAIKLKKLTPSHMIDIHLDRYRKKLMCKYSINSDNIEIIENRITDTKTDIDSLSSKIDALIEARN